MGKNNTDNIDNIDETKKVLEIKDLTISSKINSSIHKTILENISFSIFSGQIVGIVGETGSGKTLTMLSIMNMLPDNMNIESGKIIFMGKDLIDRNQVLNQKSKMPIVPGISMIFQNQRLSLSPIYKISSQMRDIIKVHKNFNYKIIDQYCLSLLSQVGFSNPKEIYNKHPFEISGGMLQRVMLAIAIATTPKLLIADEPTTALDADTQVYILELIKNYQKKFNNNIIIVTHDFFVVKKICTHVIVIKDGKIIEKNTVDNILRNPKHEYTKNLVDVSRYK